MTDMSLIGKGLYSLSRASRLVGADPRSVRRWMLGYTQNRSGKTRTSPPLWNTEFSESELPEPTIGFRDLLELRLVNVFAKSGVDLRVIRATADAARRVFGSDYPLTMKRFLTDGKRIFADAVAENGLELMIDPVRGQYVFGEIIRPSLYASIEYEDDDARRWYPAGMRQRSIMLDPKIQFGAAIVTDVGIPTDTLYAAYRAEDEDREMVARIFDISRKHVDAAVDFEEKLAA